MAFDWFFFNHPCFLSVVFYSAITLSSSVLSPLKAPAFQILKITCTWSQILFFQALIDCSKHSVQYKPPFLKVRDIIRKGIDFDLKDESLPSPYILEPRIQLPSHSSMPLSSTALCELPSTPLLGIH